MFFLKINKSAGFVAEISDKSGGLVHLQVYVSHQRVDAPSAARFPASLAWHVEFHVLSRKLGELVWVARIFWTGFEVC